MARVYCENEDAKLFWHISYLKSLSNVSIPLRGKGYEKPYTHGNLVTFSFQRAFAPSYGNKDVTSKVSIQFSWYRLLFPANKNNLTEKLPDVNPKNQHFLKITEHY